MECDAQCVALILLLVVCLQPVIVYAANDDQSQNAQNDRIDGCEEFEVMHASLLLLHVGYQTPSSAGRGEFYHQRVLYAKKVTRQNAAASRSDRACWRNDGRGGVSGSGAHESGFAPRDLVQAQKFVRYERCPGLHLKPRNLALECHLEECQHHVQNIEYAAKRYDGRERREGV